MKKCLLLILLLPNLFLAQKNKSTTLGKTTLEELKMNFYAKDSSAAAVILYEQVNRYPDENNKEIPKIDYYYRIKIFDKSAFDLADIEIYLREEEKLNSVSAITYNLTETGSLSKKYLSQKNIFTLTKENGWKSKKFTLPEIKEGSVIEYTYSVSSPYLVIDDWHFQSDIPKIKSNFHAAVLANYKYNIKINGFKKLDRNNSDVIKECVYVEGIGHGSCITYDFGMDDIPAFEEEDYMLSKKNYLSKLIFDLKSKTGYDGIITNYTTSWKEADKKLKKYFFNNQTSKKSFFKKVLPDTILTKPNALERAKDIYSFIQKHYTWNGDNWRNSDAKVKKAFDQKSGDVGEINLSLFNSLMASNIDVKLVVLSTRNNGLTSKLYPVIFDYNYLIVQAVIKDKVYYLDATNKFSPFGEIPFKAINGEARVLDFKEESYWVKLKPIYRTSINNIVRLKLTENDDLKGTIAIQRSGFYAKNQRQYLNPLTEKKHIENFEDQHINMEVDEYKVINQNDLNKKLIEHYKVSIHNDNNTFGQITINPIFLGRLKKNPFKLKERKYPVDFGYTRTENYSLALQIPDGYTVDQLPKDIAIGLPNKGGTYTYKVIHSGSIISIFTKFTINKRIFSNEEYFALKEFYNQIINSEKTLIRLKKK